MRISNFPFEFWLITTATVLALGGMPGLISVVQADDLRIETTMENGVKIDRHLDANGSLTKRVETSSEAGSDVIRTYDGAGDVIEITRVTVTTDPKDSTTSHRKVRTKKYRDGSRKPYETMVQEEEEGLLNLAERILKQRTTITKSYTTTKPRKLVNKVVEEIQLVRIDEFGVPIFEGKRTTTNADGESVEVMDPRTGEWSLDPSSKLGGDSQNSSINKLSPEVAAAVRAACRTVKRRQQFGFVAGPINLEGDWARATATVVQPFYRHYQSTMQQAKDGANYTFGQVKGYYTALAYITILEVIKCNMAVIREQRRINASILRQAKLQACALRKFLAGVIPDSKAMARPDWGELLREMDAINPCD